MRTTLTIDDDVAIKLKRLAKGGRFKDVANRALRLGLLAMEAEKRDAPYRTQPVVGRPRVANLDNIGDIIAEHEQDDWRWLNVTLPFNR